MCHSFPTCSLQQLPVSTLCCSLLQLHTNMLVHLQLCDHILCILYTFYLCKWMEINIGPRALFDTCHDLLVLSLLLCLVFVLALTLVWLQTTIILNNISMLMTHRCNLLSSSSQYCVPLKYLPSSTQNPSPPLRLHVSPAAHVAPELSPQSIPRSETANRTLDIDTNVITQILEMCP